jgi:hypothetical protein
MGVLTYRDSGSEKQNWQFHALNHAHEGSDEQDIEMYTTSYREGAPPVQVPES